MKREKGKSSIQQGFVQEQLNNLAERLRKQQPLILGCNKLNA